MLSKLLAVVAALLFCFVAVDQTRAGGFGFAVAGGGGYGGGSGFGADIDGDGDFDQRDIFLARLLQNRGGFVSTNVKVGINRPRSFGGGCSTFQGFNSRHSFGRPSPVRNFLFRGGRF